MPDDKDLGLLKIENQAGLSISLFPNGSIFAIEHRCEDTSVIINQILGSPLDGGIGRIYFRVGDATRPHCIEIAGPNARVLHGAAKDCFVWEGELDAFRHRVTLFLHPQEAAWIWRLDITNTGKSAKTADAILIQDLGLGERGLLMTMRSTRRDILTTISQATTVSALSS